MRVVEWIGTCSDSKVAAIAETKGRAFSYAKAKKLVKEFDPALYEELQMDFENPWADQTKLVKGKYLIVVSSAIDYVFLVEG